jgi:hypothetical protein
MEWNLLSQASCCCLNKDTIVIFIAMDLSSASQHHDCVFTLFQEMHQKLRMQILYNGLYNCISSLMLVLQYHRCKWLYKIQLPEKSLFFFHHFLRTWAWQFLLNIMVFSSSYWKICYWYFYMASMLQTYNTTFQTLDPSWVLNFSVHC